MEEEEKKHPEAQKPGKKIFREIDESKEHFIEATKKITEAEKHLEAVEKERAQTERAIRKTEEDLKKTQEEIARVHESGGKSKPSKPGSAYESTRKTSPPKGQQG
jgi:septal ring factor EnvC (AmiA/AmiB activator)